MRRGILLLTLVGAILLACTGGVLAQKVGSAPPRTSASGDVAPGEILVKFKKGISTTKKQEAYEKKGGKVKKTIPKIDVDVVEVPSGEEHFKVAEYESDPNVEFAEVNGIYQGIADEPEAAYTPNDPRYSQQYQYAKIQADEAWDVTRGDAAVKIAILDSGIDQSHEDLSSKIVAQKNFTTTEATVDDLLGHGTHVAGSAAADTNNSIGVAGTCSDCTLYNAKVLDANDVGQWDWIASGITWAVDPNNDGNTGDGAKVINMSLGGGYSQTVELAVNEAWSKGAIVVAAAGNNNTSTKFYPAALDKVIAVASTNSNDNRSSFSNYGADWVDVAAPGSSILSTAPDHNNVIWGTGVKYGYGSGTSMATPHVAGLAGLIWSKNGLCTTNTCVRNQIEDNVDKISGTGTYWAKGRINANGGVGGGTTPPPPDDTTPPETSITSGPSDTVDSTSATFGFSSSESDSTFECRLDNDSWSPCTSPKEYTGLSSGSHTFEVKATDAADNTDLTPASRTWTIEPGTTDPPPTDPPTGGERVTICHQDRVTITVDSHAWAAHERHGDTMGSCST